MIISATCWSGRIPGALNEYRSSTVPTYGPSRPSTCWPGDNLDGYLEFNPPSAILIAYWDAEILDTTGVPSPKILPTSSPFDVRFRLELTGPAWRCMTGDWVFDLR